MPDEVILTTDEQLWDVLTPLLDTLDNTVADRFPEEAVVSGRLDLAKKNKINAEKEKEATDNVDKTAEKLIKTYTEIYTLSQTVGSPELTIQGYENVESNCKLEVEKFQTQLNSLTDTETARKESLSQSLKKAQQDYNNAVEKRKAATLLKVLRGNVGFEKDALLESLTTIESSIPDSDERAITDLKKRIAAIRENTVSTFETVEDGYQRGNLSAVVNDLVSLSREMAVKKEKAEKEFNTSKAQIESYTKESTELREKYRVQRESIKAAIEKIKKHKTKGSAYTEISADLKELSNLTPGLYSQTIKDFNTACNCAEHLRKDIAVRENLSKKYSEKLKQGGDTHTLDIEVEVGVGFEVLIADIRATVIVGMELEVTKLGDGKLQAKRKLDGKINIRGRAGVELSESEALKIRAGLKGITSIDKGRIYNSMDDFISEESKTCMAAVIAGKDGKAQRKYISETQQLLSETNSNFSLLQNRLTLLGALTDKTKEPPVQKKLRLVKQQHIDMVTSISKSASFDAAASATFKVNDFGAGVGLGGGASMTATTKYRSISYLDDITEQPVLQKIYAMKNPKNMGFYVVDAKNQIKYLTENQAMNEMDRIEKDIARYKTRQDGQSQIDLANCQENILNNIKLLHAEYDSYVTLKNYIDHGNDNADAKKRIKELNKRRGVNDEAEYVKAMALQFATIRGLYEGSFDSPTDVPDEAKSLSTSFSEDLKIPRIKMSSTSLKKAFGTEAKTDTTVVTGFNGYFHIDAKAILDKSADKSRPGISFKVAASYEQKEAPNQPLEENFKLKFNTNLGAKGDNYIAQLFQIADISKRFKDDAADIQKELKGVFANVADGCVELDFVRRKGKWTLKSAKGYDEQDKKIGGKLTVGTDVQLIAGLTLQSKTKRLRNVYFGTKTLAALTDIYRAKHFDTADSSDNWNKFRKEHGLLKKMVAQLKAENPVDAESQSDTKKTLTGDVEEWITDLSNSSDTEDNEAVKKFKQAWNNGQGEDDAIEEALNTLVKHKVKAEDKATAESFLRRRKMERRDINDYAAKLITDDIDNVLTEYKAEIGTEDVNSIDKLLTKAKTVYDKDKSERNFKFLKKVYAIDYASRQLDDLARHGDVEDQNKAIAMLGSEMQSMLDSDKVYLSDRVEGKLIRKSSGQLEVQPVIRKGLSKTIKQSEIATLSESKMKGLTASTLTPQMTNDRGEVVSWKSDSYRESAYDSYKKARSKKSHSLRSMKTRLKWSNRISISDAIAKVMEQRYKKQQQQQKRAALQRHSSQKSAVV